MQIVNKADLLARLLLSEQYYKKLKTPDEKIGDIFSIHPLTMENILNTGQKPKIEEYDNYIFIVLKILEYDDTNNQLSS